MSAAVLALEPRIALRPAATPLVLLGVGAIGRELLRQLADSVPTAGLGVSVCALVDRSGYVVAPKGLTRRALLRVVEHKRSGGALCSIGSPAHPLDAVAFIASQLPPRSILVDATAADTHAMLEIVLERGWDVALANKVPIAGDQLRYDVLRLLALRTGARILHEATVGAGLPVLDTLHKLVAAGDQIHTIEGCPSGTLGFLFGQLARGRRFSAALRDAIDAGYTEPDPRIDLSGVDVARKALILARAIGFRGDVSDVRVQSLIPPALRKLPLPEFLKRLPEFDASWRERVAAARRRRTVLRYRARVTPRGARVSLGAVPLTSAESLLEGTDNQFTFTTARYRRRPLAITGPGAGAAVTAAGVHSDVLRLIATAGVSCG